MHVGYVSVLPADHLAQALARCGEVVLKLGDVLAEGLVVRLGLCELAGEVVAFPGELVDGLDQARVVVLFQLRAELKAKRDYVGLSKLPRDASPTRVINRCAMSGRRRGYWRKFGVSRLTFREAALNGLIPGVTKASW